MNAPLSQTIILALGWTLVHFVWEGFAIAALLAVGLRMFKTSPAHYKYLAGCAAMLLMAIAPMVTLILVAEQNAPLPQATRSAKSPWTESIGPAATTLPPLVVRATSDASALDFSRWLEMQFPLLVLGWVAGVCALSCRLLVGWLQVRRLRRTATHPLPPPWPEKLAALAQRLGVHRPLRLLQSTLIEVPTVIGWLRPVILLPASCVTGLTPGQLESIIAHELAHIRRHDYLINLLQSAVETLLFYHPAVWWVSRRVRDERENCCDDLAVAACGDLVGYARALATLEELRPASAQLMLAAGGAPLLQRIRRLAGQPERSAGRASWPVAGIAVLLVLGVLAAGRIDHRAVAAGSPEVEAASGTQDSNATASATVSAHTNDSTNNASMVMAKQTEITTLIQEGKYLYGTGKYNEAEVKFKQALMFDPANLVAFQYLRLVNEKFLPPQTPVRLVAESTGTGPTSGVTTSPGVVPQADTNPVSYTITRGMPLNPGPQININARFVEITTAPGETNAIWPGASGSFTGVLTDPQFRATINALQQRNGTDVLAAPEVITRSGQQAQMQMGDVEPIILPGKGTNASTTNKFFGITLDSIATLSADKKSISMLLIPSITEFLGYVNVSTNGSVLPMPHYRLRQATANVTVWDGQTVVVGRLAPAGTNAASQPDKKEIIVFVTATIVKPDGRTPYHTKEEREALWALQSVPEGSTDLHRAGLPPPQVSTNK